MAATARQWVRASDVSTGDLEQNNANLVMELRSEIDMLRRQISMLIEVVARATGTGGRLAEQAKVVVDDEDLLMPFRSMSSKQNAALQMILRGAKNQEIANRFGVTESTAKVYVAGIMRHVGVTTRSQIVAKMKRAFDNADPQDYQKVAGVPHDWDSTWPKHKGHQVLDRRRDVKSS